MSERIGRNCNKDYRKKHPSLQYSLWDAGNITGDIFVILSTLDVLWHTEFQSLSPADKALLLNLQEMFISCVLQTLRSTDLQFFLPDGTPKPWSGLHLNVVLPLFQGFTDGDSTGPVTRQSFADALHSPNDEVRKWAKLCRDSFNDLRDSPDPRLRDYWQYRLDEATKLANQSTKSKKPKSMYGSEREKLKRFQTVRDSGGWARVSSNGPGKRQGLRVRWNYFDFNLQDHLKLPVKVGDRVLIRPLLFDTPQELAYARKSLPTDPASRLMIALRVQKDNQDHWRWLSSSEQQAVFLMNYLADCLEGLTIAQSKALPRRRIPVNRRSRSAAKGLAENYLDDDQGEEDEENGGTDDSQEVEEAEEFQRVLRLNQLENNRSGHPSSQRHPVKDSDSTLRAYSQENMAEAGYEAVLCCQCQGLGGSIFMEGGHILANVHHWEMFTGHSLHDDPD